jgi:Helix-turn-helix.
VDYIAEETVNNLMKTNNIHNYSELCRKAGISRPSLYALIKDEKPYKEIVIKLASALNVSPNQLITHSKD